MPLRLVILGLLYLAAWAQESPSAKLIGTIEKLAGNELQIGSGPRAVTLYADRRTEVHKGRTYHHLSHLRAGDEVSASCRKDASGRLTVIAIWADLVTVRGVIHSVTPPCFDILPHRATGSESAHRNGKSRVCVYRETKFGTSKRDLIEGRDAHVVGLDVGGGNIDALRVAVYNTDLPRGR